MSANRELAIATMQFMSKESVERGDFVAQARLEMPAVTIPDSLPATMRTEAPARDLNMLADLVLNWTIGDFEDGKSWSSYYDPNSPWYGVFFGSYAIRSYKRDGQAWGYRNGRPSFREFLEIPALDYNFLMAGQFGCPPEGMCFEVDEKNIHVGQEEGWDCAEIDAVVPSGLHPPIMSLGKPWTYVVYGVPGLELLNGHAPFEPIPMRGQMYMRRVKPSGAGRRKVPQPITMAFGALCADSDPAQDLLGAIMTALKQAYLKLY